MENLKWGNVTCRQCDTTMETVHLKEEKYQNKNIQWKFLFLQFLIVKLRHTNYVKNYSDRLDL